MTPGSYSTPLAFKAAVEQRLRNEASASGMDLHRRRQLFVFDRYLARLFGVLEEAVVLKGGVAMELRLDRVRTTKDIDLQMIGDPDSVLARLQEAGRLDLGDHLSFEVRSDPRQPEIEAEGMLYQGLRFRAQGHLAGIGPARFLIYPIETHIAEKLHAYTLPRLRLNSRVKDLPDIALLATVCGIDGTFLRSALERTFEHRATHGLPDVVPAPPGTWAPVYERIAANDGLRWRTLTDVTVAVQSFLDPVLTRRAVRWSADEWSWFTPGSSDA